MLAFTLIQSQDSAWIMKTDLLICVAIIPMNKSVNIVG